MFLNRMWPKRRSIVLKWFFSYMAVLLLPIAISVIVYNESNQALTSEIHQANSSLLKQVREVMDNQFRTMERLNFEITWNLKVQDLLYSNKYEVYPNEFVYDQYQITQDLKLTKSAYASIDEAYIYIASEDAVLLPGLRRESAFAYQLLHRDKSLSYEQWKSLVQRRDFRGYIPINRVGEDGMPRKAIAYVSSYPSYNPDRPVATNVIMIDQKRILGAIDNVELFTSGRVMVLNKDNEVLVTNSNETLTPSLPLSHFTGDSGLFYYEEAGKKFEVFYIRSAYADMKYVSIIPSQLFWQKAEHVRSMTYMSIIISILGGSVLTYFFLWRNYNPIRRLVQSFAGKAGLPYAKGGNELHFLQQALDETLLEKDKMFTQMKQQNNQLRNNFIVKLLKGRVDGHMPIDEALTAYNMKPNSDEFAVLLFYLEDNQPFFEKIEQMEHKDKLKLLQFIVTNIVEELAARKHRGYMAEMDATLACLINLREGDDKQIQAEDLLDIARGAQQFLAEAYHIRLTVSVSGIHSSFSGIPQAYMEALDAMEYKLVIGSSEVLSYEEIQKGSQQEPEKGYYYPLQVEQQLINYAKIGDFDKAKQTLDDVIEANFRQMVIPVYFAKCLLFDLVSTMVKTINEIGDIQESFLMDSPKRIERLMACETFEDMKQQLTDLLRKVCEYTSAKRQKHIQQSRQRVLHELLHKVGSFIEERYDDPNLNISLIGEKFDMKATYLSKLFKDQTGEGLLDYINKVRIGKAKEMIAAQHKNVTDVASLVGYNDVNAFIRTFKKYEGITPGKYKETLDA
ncbi:helix-turn-helix domain-containing protein [Paenibacillus thalictri]|uniref:AraC family transcriptional regulator n=1 Tax=Paenibacillus thalictri TaxID=2527873 RepID=A0A4Q9DKA7_9BACL|nr:helix-turn-helix domain-containing protein [Paenibacillus thalictri]TBL74008.1 AraC family transcriptional regulator [Paenibacillus thalictri]